MLRSMYGEIMIDKVTAMIVKKRALNAVEELSQILFEIRADCTEEDFNSIRRGVGSVIGRIHVELLRTVYEQFPEIDDLKES